MVYNLIETATGRLLSDSKSPIENVAPENSVVETADRNGIWNTLTLSYDPYPAIRVIPVSKFMQRFTDDEQDALVEAAKTIAKANTFIKILPLIGVADLDSTFITGAVASMVQGGILANQARATEILSDG